MPSLLHILYLSLLIACTSALAEPIYLGIDMLERSGFRAVSGKRVGLLTHPAGVNRKGVSSVNVLRRANNVNLVALFGPEHGIYGNEKADVPIDDKVDPRTGLPVYSLYGKYRSPTPKMLNGLDAMVVDLQDVGVRSYTYVSCMLRTMEACFQHGVEVVILDRPNPLGGRKVDGPPLDKEWRSYVGDFFVPYVHGLTIAELARMAKHTPGWMRVTESQRKNGKLTVVPMGGWNRDMQWPATGLKWKATSPYIPNLSAVLGYSMTGLGAQIGGFSHGIGTPYPFRLLRFKGKSAAEVKQALEHKRISGLSYHIVKTKTAAGYPIEGVYVRVDNWQNVRPTEISFHMMQLTAAWTPGNPFQTAQNPNLFNKHVGSTLWWDEISIRGEQARVSAFVNQWEQNCRKFQSFSRKFWLYN